MRFPSFMISSAILSFLGLSLLKLTGCQAPDHSERIATLDSLEERLVRSKKQLENLDTAKAIELQEKVARQLELFQEYYENDSMGQKMYKALNEHRTAQKALKGYQKSLHKLEKEIEESEEHIEALRKDLQKGRHSPEKARKYIGDERKVLERLERSVDRFEKKTRTALKKHESSSDNIRKNLSLPDSVEWPGERKQ